MVEPRTITGRTRSSSGQHTTTIRLSGLHFLSIGASRQRLEFFVARRDAGKLIFLLDTLAWLLVHLLPNPAKSPDPSTPLYLDETAINTPSVALACAARETLRMGDIVESMLRQAMTGLMTNDRKLVAEVSRMDNIVDRLDEAIKLYVTKVTRESLDDRDGRRAMEIISFAINLEHTGDIIDKNLMELAVKKIKHKYEFSRKEQRSSRTSTSALSTTSSSRSASSSMTTSRSRGRSSRKRRNSEPRSSPVRTVIWRGCAKVDRKA